MCEDKTRVLGTFCHWQAESLECRQAKRNIEKSLLTHLYSTEIAVFTDLAVMWYLISNISS